MIGLISVNYKNSPVEIREQIHIALDEIIMLHEYIKETILLDGLFIISTCNRTEIYFDYNQKDLSQNRIFHKIYSKGVSCLK